MQYKIPVQIENEDKIFMNLSIRQLLIILTMGWIAYKVYRTLLENWVNESISLFPSGIIAVTWIIIALFKNSEMTFLPFILNLIRLNLSIRERVWSKCVDSYSDMEIWYIRPLNADENKSAWTKLNHEIYDNIEEKLKRI
jgi:hypothetical protein